MRVFLGGSLGLELVSPRVQEHLDTLISQGSDFLIGDARGMDRAFQTYLASRGSDLVTIYFAGDRPRNNLAGWPVFAVDSGLKSSGHQKHSAKDRQMADDADAGVMVWDGMSTGTIVNVMDLLEQGKPCALAVEGANKAFFLLEEIEDLSSVETGYPDAFAEARTRFEKSRRRHDKLVEASRDALDLDWSAYSGDIVKDG